MLGISRPFLVELVGTVISPASPLTRAARHDAYQEVIGTGGRRRTIDAGMNILNNAVDGLEKAHEHLLKGSGRLQAERYRLPRPDQGDRCGAEESRSTRKASHAEMTKQKERASERLKNISVGQKTCSALVLSRRFVGYDL